MANYQTMAISKAQQYGIPTQLFLALVKQESGWNAKARSPVGAQGLTQLMPATARGLGVRNPWDPAQNLDGGARYLSQQYKKFGSWEKALAAYNAGPGNVGRYQQIPETRNYVRTILANAGNIQGDAIPEGSRVGGGGRGAVSPAMNATAAPDFSSIDAGKLRAGLDTYLSTAVKRGQAPGASPLAAVNEQIDQVVASTPQSVARGANAAGAVAGAIGTVASPSRAINAAMGVRGTPYSWGGGGPGGASFGIGRGARTKGFDCSGLTEYAWAKEGVKIGSTTYQQIKAGRAIPNIAQAQPGDLIFPHAGHVQLYIGNGKVIEAPFTGGKVRVVPVGKVMAIRRPKG